MAPSHRNHQANCPTKLGSKCASSSVWLVPKFPHVTWVKQSVAENRGPNFLVLFVVRCLHAMVSGLTWLARQFPTVLDTPGGAVAVLLVAVAPLAISMQSANGIIPKIPKTAKGVVPWRFGFISWLPFQSIPCMTSVEKSRITVRC